MRENSKNAGFVPGKFHEMIDIKLLICYLLKSVHAPVSKHHIVQLLYDKDFAEYFDASAALEDLIKLGNLSEDADGFVTITQTGRDATETLESTIPLSAREKVVKEAVRLLSRVRREKENKAEIEKTDAGYYVTLGVHDGNDDLMTLKLFAPDRMQADLIREKFLNNPSTIYKHIIESLLSNQEADA